MGFCSFYFVSLYIVATKSRFNSIIKYRNRFIVDFIIFNEMRFDGGNKIEFDDIVSDNGGIEFDNKMNGGGGIGFDNKNNTLNYI